MDVQRGDWDFARRSFTPSTSKGDGIRIVARRDATTNGEASLFFGGIPAKGGPQKSGSIFSPVCLVR